MEKVVPKRIANAFVAFGPSVECLEASTWNELEAEGTYVRGHLSEHIHQRLPQKAKGASFEVIDSVHVVTGEKTANA